MQTLSCTAPRRGLFSLRVSALAAVAALGAWFASSADAAVTLSLSPTSVAFGNQTVGTTGAAKSVTVTNSGTSAATVTVSLTGGGAASFKQTNTCTASLAAGKTCAVSLTFTPATATSLSASLSVAAAGATTKTAALTGTGTAATTVTDKAAPTAVTFASTTVGSSSAAQSVTVTNTGSGSLSVSSVTITGTSASAFSQTNTCTGAIAAGKTCAIAVTFKPTAAGSASASLAIASNATGSPLAVALTGTGAAATPAYTVTPTALTFASQTVGTTSAGQTVTVKNTGTASLTVTSVAVSGTSAAAFSAGNGCTVALAAGASCAITVAFKPSAAGAASATLTVTAGGKATTATLAGTGTAAVAAVRPLPAVYTTGKAVAYSPFRAGGPGVGEVPTDAQILQDLGLLQAAGFNLLRLYGADTNASNILRLIAANYPTMSVQLGIYLEGAPATCVDTVNASEIATAITLATTYTQVATVSVGNETSLANNLPVSCLLSYVQQVRAGVTQPVTADDTASFYAGNASNGEKPDTVLPYLDFASVHTYPILNPTLWNWQQLGVASSEARGLAMMNAAIAFAEGDVAAAAAHPFTTTAGASTTVGAAMPIVIGETGWKAAWTNPSSAIELYTATVINAKDYLDLLASWKAGAGGPTTVFYFEAFDEAWKGTDDGWGLWDATRASRYALCGVMADVGPCQSPDPYLGLGYYP